MTTFRTSRLVLRPVQLEDLEAKYAIGQHPDVYQFDGFVRTRDGGRRPRTLEETRDKLVQRVAEFGLQGFGQWAVVVKEEDLFIGWCGLQFYLLEYPDHSTPEIELFYGLSRSHWGQGIIHEACQAQLSLGDTR